MLCHYLRLTWGLGGFICIRCVYSCQDRGPGAGHFLERAPNRVSVSDGCVYKCHSAEDSLAVLNPSRTCVKSELQVSKSRMLIFENANIGEEWRNSVKNTQRHSDKENYIQQPEAELISSYLNVFLNWGTTEELRRCSISLFSLLIYKLLMQICLNKLAFYQFSGPMLC